MKKTISIMKWAHINICRHTYVPVLRSELADVALKKLLREARITTHTTLRLGFGGHNASSSLKTEKVKQAIIRSIPKIPNSH